jgi:hypothetical protein
MLGSSLRLIIQFIPFLSILVGLQGSFKEIPKQVPKSWYHNSSPGEKFPSKLWF